MSALYLKYLQTPNAAHTFPTLLRNNLTICFQQGTVQLTVNVSWMRKTIRSCKIESGKLPKKLSNASLFSFQNKIAL